mmetsp:Transcript_54192/g.88411  ORF Transcript_54192/g.88411 Transcript_54192/m.88411 type:complete len:80 (+) Transcript_54192:1167-1406(+)
MLDAKYFPSSQQRQRPCGSKSWLSIDVEPQILSRPRRAEVAMKTQRIASLDQGVVKGQKRHLPATTSPLRRDSRLSSKS